MLNPTEHPRIFHKAAMPAAKRGHSVFVLAAAKSPHAANTITLHKGILLWAHPAVPVGKWRSRLWLQLILLYRAHRVRADIYHVHTPELLAVSGILQWWLGAKVIYDRHEDYPTSIRHRPNTPGWLRWVGQISMHVWEHIAVAGWVSHTLLAEDSYLGQVPKKSTVYPNKIPPASLTVPHKNERPRDSPPPLRLLVTGTLSPAWGTTAAIQMYLSLLEQTPCTLTIAGYAPSPSYQQWLNSTCAQLGIRLEGGNTFVPNEWLQSLIHNHHIGLALYEVNAVTQAKIPTCFYEYMAANLPFIFADNPRWEALNQNTSMGMPLSTFESMQPDDVFLWLSQKIETKSAYWELNTEILVDCYHQLFMKA